jgi:magnesium-transporting ATPase (P-type)
MLAFSIYEILIILAILLLNFAVIVWLKNRIVVVASVMIANLIIILLYSTIIWDYQILQELIIATIFYSITILVLISNSSHIDQIDSDNLKRIRSSLNKKVNYSLIFLITFAISCGIFYLSINIKEQPKINQQNLQIEQPGSLSIDPNQNTTQINSQQTKLKNNALFKRSTDAILIMAGVIVILLLSSKYKNRESNI